MTDKSSKLCVMKRSDYLLLGEVHVGKDTVIERDELIRREKILNNHSLTWCKMWNTGENHHHEDRIRQSKVCNSENRAELYLSYKDHKKVPGKTRPIATGCTSNTLALSNSVSSLVESLANAEEKKLEVISTEDLLYSAKMSDKETEVMRIDNKVKMIRKLRCERCKPEMKESEEDEAGDRMPAQDEGNGGLLCDQVNSLDMVAQEPADDHEIEEEKNTKMMKQILTKIIMNITIKPTMSTPDDEGGGLLCDQASPQGVITQEPTGGGMIKAILEEIVEKMMRENDDLKDQEEGKLDKELEERLHRSEVKVEEKLKSNCMECGPPVEKLKMSLLGLDVEALFPSMTEKRTGEIVRIRVMKSS